MKFLSTAVSLAAIAMTLCIAAAEVEARERSSNGTWSNSRGAFGTWSAQTSRTHGHFSRDRQWTGPAGGGSSSVDRQWDRQAGTASSYRSRTTPHGTRTRETHAQRTANGYARQKSLTTPNGKTVGRGIDVVRSGNTWSREVALIGPNGGTLTRQQTVTVDPR